MDLQGIEMLSLGSFKTGAILLMRVVMKAIRFLILFFPWCFVIQYTSWLHAQPSLFFSTNKLCCHGKSFCPTAIVSKPPLWEPKLDYARLMAASLMATSLTLTKVRV